MARPLRTATLFVLGLFCIQLAWIAALPPFRGLDEFDHAYRAAAVADGQWHPAYVAARQGRGDLLVVPRDLVTAATPVCSSYKYVGPDNCNPVADVGDGKVTVASAASRYNPVFYWVIGSPARLFEGERSLYALRISASLLAALFAGLAVWIVASWAKTPWPTRATMLSLTPMVTYCSALGAPNGVEILAALAVWAALIGVTRTDDARLSRKYILAGIPAAVTLAGVRSLGPVWLFLIIVTVVALPGRKRLIAIVRRNRSLWLASVVTLAVTVAAAAAWTLANGTNAIPSGSGERLAHPVLRSLSFIPLFIFQSIAAFPARNQSAPGIVYALTLIVMCTFFVIAFRRGSRRLKALIVISAAIPLAVSFLASALTFASHGQLWQGRYALPYMVGVPLLAVLAYENWRPPNLATRRIVVAAWMALTVAHVVSICYVLFSELGRSPLAGTSAWQPPSLPAVGCLVFIGMALWLAATESWPPRPQDVNTQAEPQHALVGA